MLFLYNLFGMMLAEIVLVSRVFSFTIVHFLKYIPFNQVFFSLCIFIQWIILLVYQVYKFSESIFLSYKILCFQEMLSFGSRNNSLYVFCQVQLKVNSLGLPGPLDPPIKLFVTYPRGVYQQEKQHVVKYCTVQYNTVKYIH